MKKLSEYVKIRTFIWNHFHHILECAKLNHYQLVRLSPITTENKDASFMIETDLNYLRVYLHWSKKHVKEDWVNGKKEDILSDLCHEAAHIIINELTDGTGKKASKLKAKTEERVVEHISRWLFQLYELYLINNMIDLNTGKKYE